MVKSFKHKGLKKFYLTGSKSGIQAEHTEKLRMILFALDSATTAQDMNLASFKLHALTGNRTGTYSVWVSGNWRVTFKFESTYAEVVNYEDYH